MGKGHNFDSSNILNIESLLPFIFSDDMKEKGIKGRVLFASRFSCYGLGPV